MAYGLDPLYVTSEDLNQYLVDKTTGAPLAGGSIYFYTDTDRTTLKNVYQLTQLSANPPNYSYTALPNPLTLSGIGTIVDTNGNQVALYYYPYNGSGTMELYYVEVYDSNGLPQFTREAWPYPNLGTGGGGGSGTVNSAAANSIAYYASTGTTVSGLPASANAVLATSGASVPGFTQLLPSQVQVTTGSLNSGTNASSTTFWRGDGTWASFAGVFNGYQIFTADDTYTTPAGVSRLIVQMVGGGGGGGGANSTIGTNSVGAGGGGGAYGMFEIISPDPSYSVTIGLGGTAGAAANGNGGDGGDTLFGLTTAPGGAGGTGGIPTGGVGPNSNGGAGGVASGFDVNISGQNGYAGIIYLPVSSCVGGEGGSSYLGVGGDASFSPNGSNSGGSPTGYGAGGSGAASSSNGTSAPGTAGGDGLVIVWEYA